MGVAKLQSRERGQEWYHTKKRWWVPIGRLYSLFLCIHLPEILDCGFRYDTTSSGRTGYRAHPLRLGLDWGLVLGVRYSPLVWCIIKCNPCFLMLGHFIVWNECTKLWTSFTTWAISSQYSGQFFIQSGWHSVSGRSSTTSWYMSFNHRRTNKRELGLAKPSFSGKR